MRYILTLLSFLSLYAATAQNTVYNYNFPLAEGGTQSTASFAGKKILIITLPVVQTAPADSLLFQLDTLASAHSATLKVIAVPALEDGFTEANKPQLLQWYRSKLSNTVLVSDGLRVRKSSGSQQHPLFKWLTDITQNEVFDIDADGPGYKFFANSSGVLYGVLRPQSRVGGISVQRTLAIQ